MQLYAITDRRLFARPEGLLKQVILWAESGVDYLQIREKDLPVHTLTALAAQIVGTVRAAGSRTRVLLNGAAEIAAATGCDGGSALASPKTSASHSLPTTRAVTCYPRSPMRASRR